MPLASSIRRAARRMWIRINDPQEHRRRLRILRINKNKMRTAAEVLGSRQRRNNRAQLLRTALAAQWTEDGAELWSPESCLGGGILEDAADLETLVCRSWQRIQEVGGSTATPSKVRRTIFEMVASGF